MKALELVLADWRETASALRRAARERDAELVDRICDEVATSAEEFVRWLSEDEACLRSGWSRARFRAHFPEWLRQGHARLEGRKRMYRMVVVPQRANVLSAWEAGRRAGTGGTAA